MLSDAGPQEHRVKRGLRGAGHEFGVAYDGGENSAPNEKSPVDFSTGLLVAGVGFEPTTFGL